MMTRASWPVGLGMLRVVGDEVVVIATDLGSPYPLTLPIRRADFVSFLRLVMETCRSARRGRLGPVFRRLGGPGYTLGLTAMRRMVAVSVRVEGAEGGERCVAFRPEELEAWVCRVSERLVTREVERGCELPGRELVPSVN